MYGGSSGGEVEVGAERRYAVSRYGPTPPMRGVTAESFTYMHIHTDEDHAVSNPDNVEVSCPGHRVSLVTSCR